MEIIQWITKYVDLWVLLFYIIIGLLILVNRKKWQVESKFILIHRTQWGIKTINKFADKNREFVKLLGYSAIGIGFVGMLVIIGFLLKGIYELLFVPMAPPTMSLVIPGVQIPGSPVFVPFWYGIIALFIVIIFHEFGHGIVARAYGIPVKSTGLVFFGPLPGAFVEPDEKKITKSPSPVQVSIFASGPFFNAILAAMIALILFLVLNPLMTSMVNPSGVQFTTIQEGQPAAIAGLKADTTYTYINEKEMRDSTALMETLSCSKPGDNITLRSTDSIVTVTLGNNPKGGDKGYMGVMGIKTDYQLKNNSLKIPYEGLVILTTLFEWIFLLSIGIGLANLLPLGPVDGGRMLHTTLVNMKGKENGTKLWAKISWVTLIILVILVFTPIIKSVFFKL